MTAGDAFANARVLITGTSSGIGRELARRLAAPGVHLALVARRAERLAALAPELTATGATVRTYRVDVRDREAMARTVQDFAAQAGGLTHVIANAGISWGDRLLEGDSRDMAEVLETNVQGMLHTLAPAVPLMVARRSGQLVAISSVAGFRGIPNKGAYCASKAAMRMLMDAFRPVVRPHGIRVTTICPGWFDSELTARNAYPMPFMVPVERAAELTLRAIARGRKTYVFPWQMRLVVPLLQRVPDRILPIH
jgi:short-subunit dehydrogenase